MVGDIQFADGTTRPLASLYAERPAALVFLRHLGCVFCRRLASQLRRHPSWNVCLVALADQPAAARFVEEMAIPFPMVCDPKARLYDHFGMLRATVGGLIGPRVVKEAMAGMFQGFAVGKLAGDPWRLGGAVVFAPDGSIAWSHRSRDAADNPQLADLARALGEAEPGRNDGEGLDRAAANPR